MLLILQQIPSPKNNSDFNIWVPLLSSICGGLLVLMGQFVDRHYKKKAEKKANLIEIYAFCRKLEANIRNNYRELAMLKTHVEYWWYCYNSQNFSALYYDSHLKSQAEARIIERQLGDNKADFIGHVRKFQVIKSIPDPIDKQLEVIADLTNPKAKSYEYNLLYDEVRNSFVETDEKNLREEYYKNLVYFQEINEILKKLIK
jgi:hypothetical protein